MLCKPLGILIEIHLPLKQDLPKLEFDMSHTFWRACANDLFYVWDWDEDMGVTQGIRADHRRSLCRWPALEEPMSIRFS